MKYAFSSALAVLCLISCSESTTPTSEPVQADTTVLSVDTPKVDTAAVDTAVVDSL